MSTVAGGVWKGVRRSAGHGIPLGAETWTRKLGSTLDRSLRRGEVDEKLLADLGWTVPQAQQFVDAYKRAKSSAQPPRSGRTSVPTTQVFRDEKPSGDRKILRAGSPVAPGAKGLNSSDRRAPDSTRELMEVGRQRVLPKYEPLMEAYYRSLTSRPAK